MSSSAAITYGECSTPNVGTMNSLVTLLVESLLSAQCKISRPSIWRPDYRETASKFNPMLFDFIVVGAGTAGSVVASRLSENPNFNVLVIEAGGDPPQEAEVPSLFLALQHSNYTYNYFVEPDDCSCKAMKHEKCYWPRGKMIGGSGGINAMFYVQGNRFDYDRWYAEGLPGWNYDSLLPYIEKATRPVGNRTHPQGYVKVNDFNHFDNGIFNMLFDAAKEMGYPRLKEFNENNKIGYAHLRGTVANGLRASTGKTHLGKVSHRPNLFVIKNAVVTRVVFGTVGDKFQAVEFQLNNKSFRYYAKKEVILSAGAINTPQILMMSGIGPAKVLNPLNLSVSHDLPIGENLQDHVAVYSFFKLTGKQFSYQKLFEHIYEYLVYGKGPFTTHNVASLTGFITTNPRRSSPDIELHHLLFRKEDYNSLDIFTEGVNFKNKFSSQLRTTLRDYDILAVATILSLPKSRGEIKLVSRSPQQPPLILANYLKSEEDVSTLVKGLKYVTDLERSEAFKAKKAELIHFPINECDKYEFKNGKYLRCYIKYFSTTMYHPVGTVKMGAQNDSKTCVDHKLRLKGVDNLRVVDASVMPYVTTGDTNAPTIVIAEKAADMIKEAWAEN